MPRWVQDDIDVACESWAFQWVRHFGRDPDRASQYIGRLNCTLGRVRELHDGAASTSDRGHQFYPEVFLGTGLLVNMAVQAMSLPNRAVLHAHYIVRCYDPSTWSRRSRPTKQAVIAADLGLSLSEWYIRRDCAKQCVATVLALGRTENAQETRDVWPVLAAGSEVQRMAGAAG